jgi:GDP-4-dehydro-6-deoxy-D-mannose reductase
VARTILITGASGFAGGHLIEALPADVRIVGWDRSLGATQDPRVTWRCVDLLDPRAVGEALAEAAPDEIYHLAGAAHVGQSFGAAEMTLATNVRGTHYLLDAVRQQRLASRILVTGSAMVYRPSTEALDERSPIGTVNPYALSKLAQEQLALRAHDEDGLDTVVVRAFNHIGPRQHPSFFASSFARQIAEIEAGIKAPLMRVGNLEARRDLTDVRDTVRAYIALMAHGHSGAVYNVCTGVAGRVGDILDTLHALARVPIDIGTDPALLRPSDTPVVLGSHERLTRDTGWRPTIGLDTTLRDLLDAWRATVRAEHRQA